MKLKVTGGIPWETMGAEFVLDTLVVRSFVADVRGAIASASSPEGACEAIRPRFAELLSDPDWLPERYQAAAPESAMGGDIGQWLLYREDDGSLSLFSLVVPAASETPIHDHLAWVSSASTAAPRTRRSMHGETAASSWSSAVPSDPVTSTP